MRALMFRLLGPLVLGAVASGCETSRPLDPREQLAEVKAAFEAPSGQVDAEAIRGLAQDGAFDADLDGYLQLLLDAVQGGGNRDPDILFDDQGGSYVVEPGLDEDHRRVRGANGTFHCRVTGTISCTKGH